MALGCNEPAVLSRSMFVTGPATSPVRATSPRRPEPHEIPSAVAQLVAGVAVIRKTTADHSVVCQ